MNTPIGDNERESKQKGVVVKLPGVTLTGRSALVVLFIVLILIAGLVIYMRPTLRMLLSAALWILFIVYWNIAAKGAAPTKSSESQTSRQLHQNLMSAALLLLFIPVPGLRTRYLPLTLLIITVGLTIQLSSALLAVWARRHLGRNWSGAVTVAVDHQLVRSGPYRLVRHPIYSAMLGMCLGTAIVSGEIHALLGLAVIAVAYVRKVKLEEKTLRENFGSAYDDYRRDTWAIIPGLL